MRGRDQRIPVAALALFLALLGAGAAFGQAGTAQRQTVYVPLHSEVPTGDRTGRELVRASVVVRNVDPATALTIDSVKYYDSGGKKVEEYVEQPVRLGPLASRNFDVGETDTRGGLTPSMIVRWHAEQAVNPPIIEGLMISTHENMGISFVTRGRVLTVPEASR